MSPEMTLLWATPVLIFAAILIGWGAETAQFLVSQGMALAILAWLQCLPEFAVEAIIAWQQKQELAVANLTGSLRLLTGFGWPLIFFTYKFLSKFKGKHESIHLPRQHGLEVSILLVASIYFCWIAFKKTFSVGDSIVLILTYFIYMFQLSKFPKGEIEEEDDMPWIASKIMGFKSNGKRWMGIISIFLFGGLLLERSAHGFLFGLEGLALYLGISSFFFVQWIAPLVSEFPEKVTAFSWARTGKKAPMALLNMIASNIVQWTLMAGMIPVIFSISRGAPDVIHFTHGQVIEIVLTVCQSFLSILFLMELNLTIRKAVTLFGLWVTQFAFPTLREEIIFIYIAFIAYEFIRLFLNKKLTFALDQFREFKRRDLEQK